MRVSPSSLCSIPDITPNSFRRITRTDLGEIYTRIYDSKPFVHAEISTFVREFEVTYTCDIVLAELHTER